MAIVLINTWSGKKPSKFTMAWYSEFFSG